MLEVAVGVSIPAFLAFGAWVVTAVYSRPTKEEVNRMEDRVIKEMKDMEARLVLEMGRNYANRRF